MLHFKVGRTEYKIEVHIFVVFSSNVDLYNLNTRQVDNLIWLLWLLMYNSMQILLTLMCKNAENEMENMLHCWHWMTLENWLTGMKVKKI